MEITQIQGQDVGNRIAVPVGQDISLPIYGSQGATPQIQNQAGQPMLIPHPDLSMAVNNQPISQPTPIQHGDTVTVNHGAPNPTMLAVHAPGQKLTSAHVGDFVKKAGLNLKEDQVLAIVQEIENVERAKFLNFIAVLGVIILILLIAVGFLWMKMGTKAETSIIDKTLSKIQKQVTTIEKDNKASSKLSIAPEEITKLVERMTALEDKIKATEDQKNQLDAETKQQIADVLKTVQQYSSNLQGIDAVQERTKALEEALKNTPAGQQISDSVYYQTLEMQCTSNECCLSSLNVMKQSSYKIAENGMCPTGEKVDRLQCLDSYVWCIPENTQSSATVPSASTVDSSLNASVSSTPGQTDQFLQGVLEGNK